MQPPFTKRLKATVRSTIERLPPRLSATTDYAVRSLFRKWGGPFNDQMIRQQIFSELLEAVPFRAIVETGTFRGRTTSYLAERSGLPVFTAEVEERYFLTARMRLRRHELITQVLGDSRAVISQLSADDGVPKDRVFFYLDAHWGADLPLREEVELITNGWEASVIMIDDFEVPGDEGYGCDDYGSGKRLRLEYLGSLDRYGLVAYFPKASSDEETGGKRGCVVLAQTDLGERALNGIASLRMHV